MKERPILFSAPMVRALLDGRKTQTRRVAKFTDAGYLKEPCGHRRWHRGDPDAVQACPFGGIGDRLWVRETWKFTGWSGDGEPWIHYRADDKQVFIDGRNIPETWGELLMDVWSVLSAEDNFQIDQKAADRKWRPSIHMPRWASRITLEVTGVRVERLQEISEDDAKAEGVEPWVIGDGWREYGLPPSVEAAGTHPLRSARDSFASLWESINGPGSWEANPFVWVIEFRRVS